MLIFNAQDWETLQVSIPSPTKGYPDPVTLDEASGLIFYQLIVFEKATGSSTRATLAAHIAAVLSEAKAADAGQGVIAEEGCVDRGVVQPEFTSRCAAEFSIIGLGRLDLRGEGRSDTLFLSTRGHCFSPGVAEFRPISSGYG
jgi:hypothetical protein